MKPIRLKFTPALLSNLLQAEGIPQPLTEYRFHDTRRWRFDFAWTNEKVALEIEGKSWGKPVTCQRCGTAVTETTPLGRQRRVFSAGGRHTRGTGFNNDMEKYNTAVSSGWRIIRATPDSIHAAITHLRKLLT